MSEAASSLSTFRTSLSLLATRRFGTFWFASLLSNIGTWAQQVAQPWLLLSLGASSFVIGLDSFAMTAPVWLLTLAGGVLADRADRRRVITLFQSIQMLCPTLIVLLLFTHSISAWVIVVLSLVVGITDALSMPAFSSIVPTIVEKEQLPAGIALNSAQFNVSRVLGPAIAGVMLAGIGAIGCFAVSAVSYLPFIGVALWILPKPAEAVRQAAPAMPQVKNPFASAREIARAPGIRGALLTAVFTSTLCGPLVTFVPVLVRDALKGDSGHFSLTVGAFGVGGVLGAATLLGVNAKRDRRRLSIGFGMLYGLAQLLVAGNPFIWALPFLMVLAGFAMVMANTSTNTLLQSEAAPGQRGQTVSLYMLAMRGGLALGSLLTGATVTLLGVRYGLALNGVLALVAQLLIGRVWLRAAPSVTARA